MMLSAGTRIGSYEIISLLGAGGMGEVYRARDTRLKRDVALKILPESFAAEAERLARFQREAEVLASLNHPNIAAIHGLEESDGTRALIMELVEGSTLADRIAQGPIPVDEALPIVKQVAEALEAAHERNIIHRDLKPANINLRPDGTVKVLDFGLAKALEPAMVGVDATASPTITSPALMTGVGVLLGTAAYMSPEQARGKAVDKRCDIWAFGCVLYEMLTARRAFDGEDVSETLAAVLKQEPSWEGIPISVRRLLRSCLDKDPRRRLRDIGDAWRLLEDSALGQPAPAGSQLKPRLRWLWPGVTAMSVLAALLLAVLAFRETLSEPSVYQFTVAPPANSTIDSFAISPDGRALAMAATIGGTRTLWRRGLESLEWRELPGTEDAQLPFWSPDSRFIGFVAQGKLKRIAANGGPAQSLSDASNFTGTWNRDGIIVFNGPGGLSSIAATGGVPVRLLEKPAQAPLLHPAFLADGKRLLYSITQGTDDRRGVYVTVIGSQDARRLLPDSSNAAFVPPVPGSGTAHLLFAREATLMAQPVDATTLQTAGDVFPVAEQVFSPGLTARYAYSVSENGTLVYQSGQAVSQERRLFWFDRQGKQLGPVGQSGRILNFALSPDETRVALARLGPQPSHWDLWIAELERGTEVRFTSDASINRNAVWAPDGGRIVFSSSRAGRTDLYQKVVGGADQEEVIVRSNSPKNAADWSRDGELLLYEDMGGSVERRSSRDIFVLPMKGDRAPVPVMQTEFNESQPQLSSDGRWLAYTSDESGRNEVYVQTFAINVTSRGNRAAAGFSESKWRVSREGGTEPRWRSDGRELFFLNGNRLMSAPVTTTSANFGVGVPRVLFEIPPLASLLMAPSFRYVVSADGNRFLVLLDPQNAAAPPLTVVVNWQSAAR